MGSLVFKGRSKQELGRLLEGGHYGKFASRLVLTFPSLASGYIRYRHGLEILVIMNLEDPVILVEDFWATINHIQPASQLSFSSDYYIFREGIKPMW